MGNVYRMRVGGGDVIASTVASSGSSNTDTGTPSGAAVGEPTFRAGTDTMLKQDDFEGYTDTADMLSSGAWIFNQATSHGGAITLDASGGGNSTSQSCKMLFPDESIAGTGASGSFTRTSGTWTAGALVGTLCALLDNSYNVIDKGVSITANTTTTISFSGDASSATKVIIYANGSNNDLTLDIVSRGWGSSALNVVVHLYFKMSSGFSFTELGEDAKFFTIEKSGIASKFMDFNVFNNSVAIPNLWGNSKTGDIRWRPRFYPTDTSTEPGGSGKNAFYVQNLATTTKRPQDVNDGQWHEMTLWRRAESVEDAGDGAIWLWIDGVLTISMDGSDASDPGYQQMFTRDWTVGGITIGANPINNGPVKEQTLWIDEIQVWERN